MSFAADIKAEHKGSESFALAIKTALEYDFQGGLFFE